MPKPLWKKGQSGNPNGRPKGWTEFRQLCRDAAPDMVKRLVSIANGETQTRLVTTTTKAGAVRITQEQFTPGLSYQIEAADKILDRAYGKPAQPLTGEDGEGPVQTIGRFEQLIVHVRHDLVDEDGNAKPRVIEHDAQERVPVKRNGSGR
jgi:hypothetical protein